MRETYIALQEIARASDALIDRCAVRTRRARPASSAGAHPRRPKPIDNAFQLWQGRVTVHDRQVFTRRPADLVRIFAVAETYGAPVYSYARDLLVQELQRLGPSLAADRDAHLEFWQYLVRRAARARRSRRSTSWASSARSFRGRAPAGPRAAQPVPRV